jgi:hypothetical protein
MTTPQGDLPDWQAFTAPPVLVSGLSDIQANINATILQSGTPFRVWGVWVRMSMSTSAGYVAAILEIVTQIVDGNGNVLLEVACHVTAANQSQHDCLAIPVPGFTPALSSSLYAISLKTGASAANVFYRGGGGIYYSQP